MPVTAAQLAANTAKATFRVRITTEDPETGEERTTEEPVNLKYYPDRVTEKTMALAQAFEVTGAELSDVLSGFDAFNKELVRLIKWWDVRENDGVTMFPIDAARLPELSISFRGQLLVAIVEGISPETMAPQMNGAH